MDAIAIQEANKIRAAMGLALLPVPGATSTAAAAPDLDENGQLDTTSTLEKRSAAADDNWRRLQAEQAAKAERIARKEAAKKAREKAQRFAVLEGRGLGEADEGEGEELDTRSWLLQQKSRQQKIEQARRYEEEQAAREEAASRRTEYTAKDLAGVKVAHELDDFDAGDEQILTLKDAEIRGGDDDDDEVDELENVELRDRERLNERLEAKKNKPAYNVYDDDVVDESGQKKVLAQYDEEIEGKKRKAFVLDGRGSVDVAAQAAKKATIEGDGKGVRISLDDLMEKKPISDYQEASTAPTKVRKPKKNKTRTTRQKAADDDDVVIPPTPQPAPAQSTKRVADFDDDEDLQANLAKQRRLALKQRKKTDAAEMARRIREEEAKAEAETGEGDEEEPGLVIDETTEFVSNLRRAAVEEDDSDADDGRNGNGRSTKDADGDTGMTLAGMSSSHGAGNKDDQVEDDEYTQAAAAAAAEAAAPAAPLTSTGFDQEETLDQGMGASLAMLRKRGLVEDTGSAELNAKERAREQFLAERGAMLKEYDEKAKEQRERDRSSGRFDRMSARERDEYARRQNESREAFLASMQAEHFRRSYRPEVRLVYKDEHGRELGAKEAFKHLSHQFHGKGSGKGKTEKRLKRIADEKREEAKSALDGGQASGMNTAVGAAARKNRQAGVRLQ